MKKKLLCIPLKKADDLLEVELSWRVKDSKDSFHWLLNPPGLSTCWQMSSEEDNQVEFSDDTLAIIAKPLASPKLQKRLFKLTKKASKDKHLKRGVKEVVKAIRKGVKG